MEKNSSSCVTFKTPSLPNDSSSNLSKQPLVISSNETLKSSVEDHVIINTTKPKVPKTVEKSQVTVPLPYEEPEWKGQPPVNYNLEIIKNGTMITTLSIKASLVVFGRLDVCDVVFEHPSVSRYHAIIQYCKGDDTHPKGFYLYDLGSTHGTFLNKEKINSKIYYKLKVGYILKFGGSSRLHIFQGPEEEEEEANKQTQLNSTASEKITCDWGLGEEAVEDDDLTENPFAPTTPNEDLYLEDPKKTLRGWFEREGYELEYSVEEKGFRTFSCTIRLPVDNPTGEFLPVEASVSGKKKEAVIACALEACRTLDGLGLLRQSHQESRQRKQKKWEENDFYDSDEDTFYDRTGEIEKRREMRKRLTKKVEVDNFQTISTKLENINTEIEEIKNKISASDVNNLQSSMTNGEIDPLDVYMSKLNESGSTVGDKIERRKLKFKLIELEKEKSRLEKLCDIVRPSRLPPIAKHPGIIGRKPKSKLKLSTPTVIEISKPPEIEVEEENDSDEENDNSHKESSSAKDEDKPQSGKYGLILQEQLSEKDSYISKNISSSVASVLVDRECDLENMEDAEDHSESATENISSTTKNYSKNIEATVISEKLLDSSSISQTSELSKAVKLSKRKQISSKLEKVDIYKTDSKKYCTWIPPSNQSGDGVTHLNAKYGY